MNTNDLCRTAASAPDSPAPMGVWLLAVPGNAHATPAQRQRRRPIAALASALSLCAVWPVLAQTQTQMPTPTSATPAADVAAPEAMNNRYVDALQAYERNHWPQAFSAFMVLASQGHADAARVVLLMHRHGPGLYGQDFAVTASQRAFLAPLSTGSQRVKLMHVE